MKKIYLLDSYVGDGLLPETAHRPKIYEKINWIEGDFLSDQPTNHQNNQIEPYPNILIIEIACSDDTFDAILSNQEYGVGSILYDEPNPMPPDEKPTLTEYGERRSYLAKLRLTNPEIESIIGKSNNPNTRRSSFNNAVAWAKSLSRKPENYGNRIIIGGTIAVPAYTTSLGKTVYEGIQSASKTIGNIGKKEAQ